MTDQKLPPEVDVEWPNEAVCRLIHDNAGTKDPDEPWHHPAQKSWEEPILKRWQQWEGISEELRELLNYPMPKSYEPFTSPAPNVELDRLRAERDEWKAIPNTSLSVLVEKSKERLAAMSEEERAAMWQAQRESFARGMSTPCEHGVLDFEDCQQCRNPAPQVVVELPQDVINLVIAAREFWDDNNDLSPESLTLDKALIPFAARVPYDNEPEAEQATSTLLESAEIIRQINEAEPVDEWLDRCQREANPAEIPGKLEMYDGKLTKVVDASRTGWWRFHEHYDRNGYCDNPGRGY